MPRRGRKPEGLKGAPQRLRMAEWLLVHDVERTFRLDSNQRGEDFPSARGTIITSAYKSLLLWTRTRRSLEQAPQRLRMAEWLLVRARGTDKARTPETKSLGFLLYTLPRLDSNQ